MCRRAGRNCEKSDSLRACTQTGIASEAARRISARSSAGTRRAFSQSRRTTRIRLASSESYSSVSSCGASSSRSRPISSDVSASCAIRSSVASCSARTPPPPAGIFTCWSQLSSDDALSRSSISATRSFRLASAVCIRAEPYLCRELRGRRSPSPNPTHAASGSWPSGSALRRIPNPIAPQSNAGGPEGKLRGRPPPPVEPRSGPRRRTGSESGAGRARTRRVEYDY